MGPEKFQAYMPKTVKVKILQNIIMYSWQLDIKANKTVIQF